MSDRKYLLNYAHIGTLQRNVNHSASQSTATNAELRPLVTPEYSQM